MKPLVRACGVMTMLLLAGCNVTSGSRIVVGNQRPPVAPESVRIYLHPPAKYEEVALVSASSKNAFASEQSLTDSALFRMKRDAARLGANGILLTDAGSQQVGSVGNAFGSANAYSSGGATNVFGSGMGVSTAIFAKVTSGMAIYVTRQ